MVSENDFRARVCDRGGERYNICTPPFDMVGFEFEESDVLLREGGEYFLDMDALLPLVAWAYNKGFEEGKKSVD